MTVNVDFDQITKIKMFSPQDYCENCLRVPNHYYYAKKEDCICTCHQGKKLSSPPQSEKGEGR